MTSLWGEEFDIPVDSSNTKKLIDKVKKPKNVVLSTEKAIKSKTVSIEQKLEIITAEVYRILGKYKDNTIVIKTRDQLHDYITKAISNGEIAIDTETNNSLQPVDCKLMGPCIYTDGMKNAYIPVNHVNRNTGERLAWQLTEQDIYEEFSRLSDTSIIMHNGKFDYQVIKCTCNLSLKIYWDTMIAARILNENELANLKSQYISKIDSSIEKYSIEHLFQGLEYAIIDPEIFALYAATDAYMTYKLYKYQLEQFKNKSNKKLFNLFMSVEIPIVTVAAEMELTGVKIDSEYANRLSTKYHAMLDAVQKDIDKQLDEYREIISKWRVTEEANFHPKSTKPNKEGIFVEQKSKNEQLKDPPQLSSPTQFAILLYDVLKIPPVDKSSPRGTGEDILKKIDNPLCSLVLKYRGIDKLISTYIDKLPSCVNKKTNRLHASFNQLGTETGRFSSKDPNLQNIPSHEKSIRMMFRASDGYSMVGADFSQQEPRLLCWYSQDENMISAYKQDKDLYATIAAKIYHNKYEDNLEFNPITHQKQPEGGKRRTSVKSLLLGIMYGMGPASLAESIHGTIQDAQKIINDFYKEFPNVKKWIDNTHKFAKENGYVEDFWGRRRRLPDIMLKKYELKLHGNEYSENIFNPLIGSLGLVQKEIPKQISKYKSKLKENLSLKEIASIKEQARKDGVDILDNSGYISRAERQCVNARVQGGAATMSKKAMIAVYNDKILGDLGFKLMIAVHDELIGECPKENADLVADRLCSIMKKAAQPECMIPFKCDPTIENSWYEAEYSAAVKNEFDNLLKQYDSEKAFNIICKNRKECSEDRLKKYIEIS